MRAVMVDEPGSIRVAEVPDPSPAAGQVLVRTYRAALDLVGSGALRPEPLLTHALPPAEFPAALALMRSGTGLKVQVLPD